MSIPDTVISLLFFSAWRLHSCFPAQFWRQHPSLAGLRHCLISRRPNDALEVHAPTILALAAREASKLSVRYRNTQADWRQYGTEIEEVEHEYSSSSFRFRVV